MDSYKLALEYLDSFVNYEKTGLEEIKTDFDLTSLSLALERLSGPQRAYTSIHVAGTKGKGSVCTFTSSILSLAGFKTGLFTSPHLLSERERISVDGRMIPEADLVRTLEEIRGSIGEELCRELTFFEMYTLLAVLYFKNAKVDFAVFETGLGGRFDATNVLGAKVCAITPVSYDHMHVLGDTLEEIAYEKAAIIKPGSTCISSPQKEEVLSLIKEKCSLEEASLRVVGRDITFKIHDSGEEGTMFDITTKNAGYTACRTQMPGVFQAANSATAVGLCESVVKSYGSAWQAAVKRGIEKAFLPARMEIISKSPRVMIDGAQNAESARELKYSIEENFKYDKLILLLGLSRDKDIEGVCRSLAPLAEEIILTKSRSQRAADPGTIRGYLKGKKIKITSSAKEALGLAFKAAGERDLVLAAGSFYLAGEIRELVFGEKIKSS